MIKWSTLGLQSLCLEVLTVFGQGISPTLTILKSAVSKVLKILIHRRGIFGYQNMACTSVYRQKRQNHLKDRPHVFSKFTLECIKDSDM